MKFVATMLLSIALLGSLSACGQKGGLTLPETSSFSPQNIH
ncbi:MAG: lipoprotein [Pseudohongiellaceae bacterium]